MKVERVEYRGSIYFVPSTAPYAEQDLALGIGQPKEMWATILSCGHGGRGYATQTEAEAQIGTEIECAICASRHFL